MPRISASFRTLRRDEGGASATEFALLAPILVFSFLAMVDIGRAVFEKIAIDQSLRAGFEAAMSDPGEATVNDIVADAAGEMFKVKSSRGTGGQGENSGYQSGSTDTLSISVRRYCACPKDLETSISCSTRCTATTFPYAFYAMDAWKHFDGVLLPRFGLSGEIKVQVR